MAYTLRDLQNEIRTIELSNPEVMDRPLEVQGDDGAEYVKFVALGVYDQDGESFDEPGTDIDIEACRVIMYVR